MEQSRTNPDVQQEQIPKFRGLYRHVKISVKTLDKIIVACIMVIVIVVVLEMQSPGFTITFDSRGGTDVPAQNQMYGELLEVPEPPTREGYCFTGWYTTAGCIVEFDGTMPSSDLTLYACRRISSTQL